MFKKNFTRGLIVVFAFTTLCGILLAVWATSYRQVENRNFTELRKKGELDCITMPYHCAIREGSIERIISLEASGADINSLDRFGNTPLLYAINWNTSLVDSLLESGANPNIPNEEGLAPLEQSLHIRDFSLAERLIRHGADPNAKAEGDRKKYLTLLTDAVTSKDSDAATFLIKHGADPTKKDGYGYTACERAEMYQTLTLFPFCDQGVVSSTKSTPSLGRVYQNDAFGIQVNVPTDWEVTSLFSDEATKRVSFSLEAREKAETDFGIVAFLLDHRIRTEGATIDEWFAKNIAGREGSELSQSTVFLDGVQSILIKDTLFQKSRHRYFIDLGERGIASITFYSSPKYDADYDQIIKSIILTKKEG